MSARNLLLATAKTGAIPTDSNFKYVSALFHGDGTNAANNKTYTATDAASSSYTMSATGNPGSGTFTPYGTGWSAQFDGSTGYLTYAPGAATQFGTSDFTVEAWIKFNGPQVQQYVIDNRNSTLGGTGSWVLGFSLTNGAGVAGPLGWFNGSGTTLQDASSTDVTAGVWHHICYCRKGSTGTLYLDGNGVNSWTDTWNYSASSTIAYIGSNYLQTSSTFVNGQIGGIRITKSAVYSGSTFTPPTGPFTALANTTVLICQSNRFIDTSTNALTISKTGAVSIARANPFGNSGTPYSKSTYGGSMFQGNTTNDYIAGGPSLTLSGDFTIEGWIYYIGTGVSLISQWIAGSASISSYIFGVRGNGSNNLFLSYGQGTTTTQINGSSVAVVTNAWNHIAVSRSGSTVRFFVNGVLDSASNTVTGALNSSSTSQIIGSQSGVATTTTQYISDVRIMNGTALYTASFTPPTAPLTAITGTAFLYKAQDAAVFDNAMMQDAFTSGTSQLSTSQSKFGGSSMSFNGGTSNFVYFPTNQVPVWGSTNWTIEGWFYISTFTVSQTDGLFGYRNGINFGAMCLTLNNGVPQALASTSSSSWTFNVTSSGGAIALNTWHHIAMVRNGTSLVVYQNGTSIISGTISGSLYQPAVPFTIGSSNATNGSGNNCMTGFVDDFRITFGLARYTSNFSAPTAAFPNQ